MQIHLFSDKSVSLGRAMEYHAKSQGEEKKEIWEAVFD